MRIALCLEYPIAQHGGTEILVTELVRALHLRHDVVLVSPDDAGSLAGSAVSGCVRDQITWQTKPSSVKRAKVIAERIAETEPDIVHFHFGGNYAWHNRAFRKCPVVHVHKRGFPCLSTNHGAFSIFEGYCWEERHFLVKLALFPSAWLSKQYVLTHVLSEVAVSQHDYHALRRWYFPMRSKFRWIYHSRIRGNNPPPQNFSRHNIILCAGTIAPRKGQTILVEAFCRIARNFCDWELVLIGRDGDATVTRRIHELVAEHGLESQVRLLGPRTDEELRSWLQQSAIFVMPSLYEGLGLALQEALYYGCACIGTRSGGVTDLIEDGDNGVLVPPGQVELLANALKKLMTEPALRERFSARGPQSVFEKGMTAEKMVQAYEELYLEVLNSGA